MAGRTLGFEGLLRVAPEGDKAAARSRTFHRARILALIFVVLVSSALTLAVLPHDDPITPTTNIQEVDITAVGAGADISSVEFSGAKDGGTTIDVIGTFGATTGKLHVSMVVDSSSHVPCIVKVGSCSSYADADGSPFCITAPYPFSTSPPSSTPDPCAGDYPPQFDAKRTGWGPDPNSRGISFGPEDVPWSQYEARFIIPASKGKGYPVQSNPGHAALIVPKVQEQLNHAVLPGPIAFPAFQPVSRLSMCLPEQLKSFSWTYGQIPDRVESESGNCLMAGWDLPTSSTSAKATAGVASADFPAQLSRDNQATLLAGVLIGLAGSAFIALLTEWIRPARVPNQFQEASIELLVPVPPRHRPRPSRAGRLRR